MIRGDGMDRHTPEIRLLGRWGPLLDMSMRGWVDTKTSMVWIRIYMVESAIFFCRVESVAPPYVSHPDDHRIETGQ